MSQQIALLPDQVLGKGYLNKILECDQVDSRNMQLVNIP